MTVTTPNGKFYILNEIHSLVFVVDVYALKSNLRPPITRSVIRLDSPSLRPIYSSLAGIGSTGRKYSGHFRDSDSKSRLEFPRLKPRGGLTMAAFKFIFDNILILIGCSYAQIWWRIMWPHSNDNVSHCLTDSVRQAHFLYFEGLTRPKPTIFYYLKCEALKDSLLPASFLFFLRRLICPKLPSYSSLLVCSSVRCSVAFGSDRRRRCSRHLEQCLEWMPHKHLETECYWTKTKHISTQRGKICLSMWWAHVSTCDTVNIPPRTQDWRAREEEANSCHIYRTLQKFTGEFCNLKKATCAKIFFRSGWSLTDSYSEWWIREDLSTWTDGVAKRVGPRFWEFCSCCCLPLLPWTCLQISCNHLCNK